LFETGAVDLAARVNAVTGRGWTGGWTDTPMRRARSGSTTGSTSGSMVGMTVGTTVGMTESAAAGRIGAAPDRPPSGRVWLDRRLRDGWAAVPFLVPEEAVTLVDPYDPVLTEPGVAFLWPYELDPRLWEGVAPGLQLEFSPGAVVQGDLDAQARWLDVEVRGYPSATAPSADEALTGPPTHGRFANGLELVRATLRAEPARLTVDTTWRATVQVVESPTLFVQVLEGSTLIATVDAPLGAVVFPLPQFPPLLYPSWLWRPGVSVTERRFLDVGYASERHTVVAGLYAGPDNARVALEGQPGETVIKIVSPSAGS
jgi:hypothetical protein